MMAISANEAIIFKVTPDNETSGDPYQDELRKIGIKSQIIPVLSFNFINIDLLRNAFEEADKYSALVITSLRSVEAVAKVDSRHLLDKWTQPVYVVGEATANAIEKVLNVTSKGRTSGNASSLAQIIAKEMSPTKPLLFPCGNLGQETLVETLRTADANFNVETVIVYKTCPHPDIEKSLKTVVSKSVPELFIYFSPSGVNYTLPVLQSLSLPMDKIKFVALGPSTADALLKVDLKPFCVAKKPTPTSLCESISSLI